MAKRSSVIWIAAVALAVPACKGKKGDTTPKNSSTDTSKIDQSLCDEGKRRVETFDLNKDGKPDLWKLFDGTTLTCRQDDFDHDGRKDFLIAYDPAGNILYKKADFDYDGRFDMTEVFENGVITEAERDTDFDGKFDVKEVYVGGQLNSVRRDRNGDNRPDQWEQWNDGVVTSITYDDDYDGKVDRRDDNPNGTAPQAQAPAPAPTTATPPVTAPATPAQPAPAKP